MPIDIEKQVAYWRSGASEDIETARLLLERDKRREALFFAHLALEKALKALVVKTTRDLATGAVVYGSHARGTARQDSDIDVLVVSPAFDSNRWAQDQELWRLTLKADPRIEPVPVGQRQLQEDRTSPILEIARREDVVVETA